MNGLLAQHKEESIEAKDPMTRQRLAMNLQSPVVGTQMMTSQEHSEIMRAKMNFYATVLETIRREPVGYGAVVSNMAHVAQPQRLEISTIAQQLRSLMSKKMTPFYPTREDSPSATSPDPGATSPTPDATQTFLDQPQLLSILLYRWLG